MSIDETYHNSQLAADEIGAAMMNAVLIRVQQTGRSFVTATDYQALRLTTAALMQLQPVAADEHLGRPQTIPTQARSDALDDMESAIARTALRSVEPPVKIEVPKRASVHSMTPAPATRSGDNSDKLGKTEISAVKDPVTASAG